MARARARRVVLQDIAMYMLEKGEVLSRHDWEKDDNTPIRVGLIFNYFGNWSRMLGILENELPDVWKQINTPKVEPKPKVEPAPKQKVDPLEALSKAAKAEKSED